MLTKLDIGPGSQSLGKDWASVGKRAPKYPGDAWSRHAYHDLREPLAHVWADRFELIYASHVLEHLPWYKTRAILEDWRRCLQPGGRLELWVPDFDVIQDVWQKDKIPEGDNFRRHNPDGEVWEWVCGRLFCTDDTGPHDRHFAMFNQEILHDLLRLSGYVNIRVNTNEPRGFDKHGHINLGMTAERPE